MTGNKRHRDGEKRVLSYHDVLLREQDVTLLEGPHWLNDQVVTFYLEYLEHEVLRQQQQAPQPVGPTSVLLLPPSTTFLLLHSGIGTANDILAPLKPERRGLVLFALNDNEDVELAAGGSHWSLLVYHRPSNTLRHYDSSPAASACASEGYTSRAARRCGGGNAAVARQLAEVVGPVLVPTRSTAESPAALPSSAGLPKFVEVDCMPRQVNGHDCGVYVLAVARAACHWWLRLHRQPAGDRAQLVEAPSPSLATAAEFGKMMDATRTSMASGAGLAEAAVSRARGIATGADTITIEALGQEASQADGRRAAMAAEEEEKEVAATEWVREEGGMAAWLTPTHVKELRAEVGVLIRSMAAAAAPPAAGT